MLIDIRYHLASIVAVFFALGLGMLMGAQLADEGALTQEHVRLIEQVEAGLERVRQDNRWLTEQLAEADQQLATERAYADDMLAQLVAGRLGDVRVEVVAAAGADAYRERVLRGLVQAGAEVFVREGTTTDAGAQDVAGEAGSLMVFLWGETEGPGEFVGSGVPHPSSWLPGTVWAWPSGREDRSDRSSVDGVPAVLSVDTPVGLLALIDVLDREAAPATFDSTAPGP